jgi:hypothetical protein
VNMKRVSRIVVLVATVFSAPSAARVFAGEDAGLPDLRRRLTQEIADRKAAEQSLAAQLRAGDEALRLALTEQTASLRSVIDALESALRALISAGDAATLDQSRTHTDQSIEVERTARQAAVGELAARPALPTACGTDASVRFDGQAWVCAEAPSGPGGTSSPSAVQQPQPGAPVAVLFLNGEFAARAVAFEGGGVVADVITNSVDRSKHPGGARFTDIVLTAYVSQISPALASRITPFLMGTQHATSGTVYVLAANGSVTRTVAFDDAHVSAVEFPALTTGMRTPCALTITFRPGSVTAGGPAPLPALKAAASAEACSFGLEIPPLGDRIVSVGGLSARSVATTPLEDAHSIPLSLPQLSNVTVTLAREDAYAWLQWASEFILQGNNGQEAEREGTLVLRGATSEIARLTLSHLGIFQLLDKRGPNGEDLIEASLYMEGLGFRVP